MPTPQHPTPHPHLLTTLGLGIIALAAYRFWRWGEGGGLDVSGEDAVDKKQRLEALRKKWDVEQAALKRRLVTRDLIQWWLGDRVQEQKTEEKGGVQGRAKGRPLSLVGGVDISFLKDTDEALAALCICEFPSMKVLYEDYKKVRMVNPYIAGYLAFREVDSLVALYNDLKINAPSLIPDVILVDGNGILHPRGCGLASHFGVLIGKETIGVGKKLHLVDGLTRDKVEAKFKAELKKPEHKNRKFAMPLTGDSGKVLGCAVRTTTTGSRPIYVSIGHGVSLETAKNIVLACSMYRIPEPVRQADLRSRDKIRQGIFD